MLFILVPDEVEPVRPVDIIGLNMVRIVRVTEELDYRRLFPVLLLCMLAEEAEVVLMSIPVFRVSEELDEVEQVELVVEELVLMELQIPVEAEVEAVTVLPDLVVTEVPVLSSFDM